MPATRQDLSQAAPPDHQAVGRVPGRPAPRHRPVAVGHLRAFDAVARHLNFRKAGEDLFLSQPAISRQIQALEEEVGLALFIRHTRSVELTEAGSQLYRALRPSLERIDQTVTQMRQQHGRRSVAITTFASFASMWAIPQLERFQTTAPDVDFRIDASDHYIDIQRSDQDIALRLGPSQRMPADAILLFEERLVPMANPLLVPQGGLRNIQRVADFTLIENQEHDQPFLTWVQWLDERGMGGLSPKRWLRFNYVYQMLQVGLAGQGLLLARLPMMSESVLRGDLVELFPGRSEMWSQPPLAYWMEINRHSALRPEVKALSEWLVRAAQESRALIEQRFPKC